MTCGGPGEGLAPYSHRKGAPGVMRLRDMVSRYRGGAALQLPVQITFDAEKLSRPRPYGREGGWQQYRRTPFQRAETVGAAVRPGLQPILLSM